LRSKPTDPVTRSIGILPTLGDVRLKALTPAKVPERHASLADSTGPTAQAQAHRLLRTICNKAAADGQITSNLRLEDSGRPAVVVRQTMTRLRAWMVGTPKADARLRPVTLPRFLHTLLEDHLQRYVGRGDGALVFATASG
jgi:hypothetical protein